METKTERLDCIVGALRARDPDMDDEHVLHWAVELRMAALFLEDAPEELYEAARRRFQELEAAQILAREEERK